MLCLAVTCSAAVLLCMGEQSCKGTLALTGCRMLSCLSCLQSPLQLQVRNASISRNTVTRGLMWLRLVNTSMHDVNISSNIAVNPAGTSDAAAAAAVRGAAAVAGRLASGMGTQPPHLCDMGALERALLQVQGAAAFDMFRSVLVVLFCACVCSMCMCVISH